MFFILPFQHSSNSCLFSFKFWFLFDSPIHPSPFRALSFGIRAWILGTSLLEYKIMGSKTQNISSLRPFFDGSNYSHWKFKIELYLDCDSIKRFINAAKRDKESSTSSILNITWLTSSSWSIRFYHHMSFLRWRDLAYWSQIRLFMIDGFLPWF